MKKFSYDSIAAAYAENVDNAPFNALYERPAMMSLLPELEGQRVLDAGCGSGWYAEQLLARGASVDAVDSSSAMVEYARVRLHNLGPPQRDRVTIRVADLSTRLTFDDSTFNGIICPLVLHYMRDWRPALAEMRRVVKKPGWLLLSTHHPGADADLFKTTNYLETEHVVDDWDWVGEVKFFRRSLTEIITSLRDTGWTIDRLVEPIPTEEFRRQKPDSYQQILQQPAFLIIRAEKGEAA